MIGPLVLATLLALPSAVESTTPAGPIRVAVASSAQGALADLAAEFEATSGARIDLIVGSTGKLYAQILHGAPFDLFFAADLERPQRLVDEGLAETVIRFARGRLVFWAAGREAWRGRPLVDVLRDPAIRRVALANPRVAPYGRAARQLLAELGSPVAEERLVYGENVGQALQLVASGAADAGFVAHSQLSGGPLNGATEVWLVQGSTGASLDLHQGAVRLLRCDQPAAAEFLTFVQSSRGAEILSRRGFEVGPVSR